MARRTITVEDVNTVGGVPLWEDIPYRGYVGSRHSVDPWQTLLWREIKDMERAVRMTHRQAQVFEAHILGVSNKMIATLLNISESAVSKTLRIAMVKSKKFSNLGILTCIYEECGGWNAVSELLNS